MKALGVGLAAGVRRNMTVMRGRLNNYASRLGHFRRLQRAGVSIARLVRTGLRAMTYGQAVLGVSCSFLKAQRQVVAAAVSPGAGTGGQNMDLALMLADGGTKGRADPAFDAHLIPIGDWAKAVWEGWTPTKILDRMVSHARRNLEAASNKWAVVYEPAAALLLTCKRIGWDVLEAASLKTDLAEVLDLRLDPPS